MGHPYIYPLQPGDGSECGNCEEDDCQECCQHDDMDHGECCNCGMTMY